MYSRSCIPFCIWYPLLWQVRLLMLQYTMNWLLMIRWQWLFSAHSRMILIDLLSFDMAYHLFFVPIVIVYHCWLFRRVVVYGSYFVRSWIFPLWWALWCVMFVSALLVVHLVVIYFCTYYIFYPYTFHLSATKGFYVTGWDSLAAILRGTG